MAKSSQKPQKDKTKRGTTAYDKALGVHMRRLRIERGMSQEALGEILGLTFQQIQKYEKGVNRVAPGRLAQVASAFGLSLAQLLEPVDRVESAARGERGSVEGEVDAFLQTSQAVRMMRAYMSLGNADLQSALVIFTEKMARASG